MTAALSTALPTASRQSRSTTRRWRRCSSSWRASLVGVLVEAFAPRGARHGIQVGSPSLGALVAAFAALVLWSRRPPDRHRWAARSSSTASGAVPAGRPCCSSAVLGVLTWPSGSAASAPTPSPRWVPRRRARPPGGQRRPAPGYATSEVFPLTLFAVFGMMMFLAANDLITMFVGARGALAAALRPDRPGPPPSPALAGGLAEVLPAGRLLVARSSSSARHCSTGMPAPPTCGVICRAPSPRLPGDLEGLLVPGVVLAAHRPAVQGRRRAVPLLDARRLPGCPDPGHRLHGRLHQARGLRCHPARRLSSASRPDALGVADGRLPRSRS